MFLGPWSEMHRLNLGWFIAEWNKFYAEWQSTLQAITGALTGEIERVEAAMTDLYAARDAAAASATSANSSALNASASSLAAMDARDAAVSAKNTAQSAASSATASETAAGNSATLASNKATQASNSATAAAQSATGAASSATTAGEKATQAASSATTAGEKATQAANSASAAQQSETDSATQALKSEGFAVGQQNGVDVPSDSPYYHNNAKYYTEQGGGGGSETWEMITINLSNWDDALGMFVFDAGDGNKISEIKFAGQFVYNEGITDLTAKLGFGITADAQRDKYSIFASVNLSSTTVKRLGIVGSAYKIENTAKTYRGYIGEAFYGQNNILTTAYSVDLVNTTPMQRTPTSLYGNFNDPRYFKIALGTKPDWAEFYLTYKL